MTTTPNPAPVAAAPARTLSILSLVAALVSIPLGHIFLLPIAAIILGFIAREREPWGRSLSIWGIILGFVILFGWVILGVIAAAVWVPLAILHSVF
jgi:hypothetical protein